MATAYQLFRPLAFMAVKGTSLHVYRLTLPLIMTVVTAAAFVLLPEPLDLVGDKSASDYLAGFFATLPGFFIAALAAVASFNGGDLDKELPGVTVSMTVQGDSDDNAITLRVFLCYLFAYLTVLSFVGFFVCVGGALLTPSITHWIGQISNACVAYWVLLGLKVAFLAAMTFLAASVVFCTLQGLYFLAERVHQNLLR